MASLATGNAGTLPTLGLAAGLSGHEIQPATGLRRGRSPLHLCVVTDVGPGHDPQCVVAPSGHRPRGGRAGGAQAGAEGTHGHPGQLVLERPLIGVGGGAVIGELLGVTVPVRDGLEREGLTAEEFVKRKNRKGYMKREWRKTRERNEPLDCRVYARAAAAQHGLDRWRPERWMQEITQKGLAELHEAAPLESPSPEGREARLRRIRRGRFRNWRG